MQKFMIDSQRNWPLINVFFTAGVCSVACVLEITIMSLTLVFMNQTYTQNASGSSPIIVFYFCLFIFGLLFQMLGSIDAWKSNSTMYVIAVSFFNLWSSSNSIIQIFQAKALTQCAVLFSNVLQAAIQSNFNGSSIQGLYAIEAQCYLHVHRDYIEENGINMVTAISVYLPLLDAVQNIMIGLSLFMVTSSAIGLIISYRCYTNVGWNVYVGLGADKLKKRMLERYHLFILFLKISVYFFLGLASQVLGVYYFSYKMQDDFDTAILKTQVWGWGLAMLCLVILYYFMGVFGARKESSVLMAIFLILSFSNLGCLTWLLVVAYWSSAISYRSTIIWLTCFILLQIISNIMTIYTAFLLMRGFHKGDFLSSAVSVTANPRTANPRFELD